MCPSPQKGRQEKVFTQPHLRQINENHCLPWNLPSPDGHPCCNPLEQHEFFKTFGGLGTSEVAVASEAAGPVCLPDCAGTVYSARVTTAPFRRCDAANMGLSRLCKPSSLGDGDGPVPQKWGGAVVDAYKNSPAGKMPEYISEVVKRT